MRTDEVLISLAAFALAAVLTGIVRRFALARGLLDVPNARSSHSAITPRGGGLAIVSATTAASIVLLYLERIPLGLFIVLAVGGGAVATIGFMDDRRPMPAWARLAVHVAAAVWAISWLGAPSSLRLGHQVLHLGWGGAVLAVLGIVWSLNFFNFMDGIDGIAASEAAFIGNAGGALVISMGVATGAGAIGVALGAACLGFLVWNWPPAKIFMGDVGSGYLGYVIAVLALATARESPVALWIWLILGGAFFVDATVTLVRRMLRGDRLSEAHRSHAYQWLARRWQSHKLVTMATIGVNLLWLLPCAYCAVLNPTLAAWIVLVALAPLLLGAIAAGAGEREAG